MGDSGRGGTFDAEPDIVESASDLPGLGWHVKVIPPAQSKKKADFLENRELPESKVSEEEFAFSGPDERRTIKKHPLTCHGAFMDIFK